MNLIKKGIAILLSSIALITLTITGVLFGLANYVAGDITYMSGIKERLDISFSKAFKDGSRIQDTRNEQDGKNDSDTELPK